MKDLFYKSFQKGDSVHLVIQPGIEISGRIKEITKTYVVISGLIQETVINLDSIIFWRNIIEGINEISNKAPKANEKENIEPDDDLKNSNEELSKSKDLPKTETSLKENNNQEEEETVKIVYPPSESEYESVPWTEVGIPDESLFKGRSDILEKLLKHYTSSINRKQTYILYGLTRTGKTTIIEYLSKDLETKKIQIDGQTYNIAPFVWNFGQAASNTKAEDMWTYLVNDCIINKLKALQSKKHFTLEKSTEYLQKVTSTGKFRFATFKKVITDLKLDKVYPVILIDEFTYFKSLNESSQLDSSFLSVIRELTMKGLVSFLFAGTYDIKDMMNDPEIGITGQFANTIDYEVNQIGEEYAKELINVWNGNIIFSDDAISYILRLTNRIPYFIQILCKNIGYYSLEKGIKDISFDNVEEVVKFLVGEIDIPNDSMINPLSEGVFLNNQFDPRESNEIIALISTLAFFNKSNPISNGVTITEIFQLWDINKLVGINVLISSGLQRLKTKGIVIDGSDNDYYISVDLFRRWWYLRHNDIKLELNFLEGYYR